MTNCLVTGGAGFIGAHLVKYLLAETDWNVRVIDKMNYASCDGKRLSYIGAFKNPRFSLLKQDVGELIIPGDFNPHFIVHMAAETHVERSIQNPGEFLMSNVFGTYAVLQYAREQSNLQKMLYFSTDEVFGAAVDGRPAHENSAYNSGNPYAATKAAGEELALAWANTFGIPVVVSHCSNVFGEWQHEEKYIPKLVRMIARGHTVKIHADAEGNIGARMYIYAGDVARAVMALLMHGETREKYNIPGEEQSNLDMATKVATVLGKPLNYEKSYPAVDRPGWDRSYFITGEKLRAMGWRPVANFDAALREVVEHTFRALARNEVNQ